MRIDPRLDAIRRDPAPLHAACRAADAAVRDWRQAHGALLDELAHYGAGEALADCPQLTQAFVNPHGNADALARSICAVPVRALSADQLAQLPWRHFTNGVLHSIAVASAGEASLSLALIDGAAWAAGRDLAAPRQAALQPGMLHTRVVSGEASALLHRITQFDDTQAHFAAQNVALLPGAAFTLDGAGEALEFTRIGAHLLTLRLHRSDPGTQVAREYDLATGALVHRAASRQADSRAEMIMAVLRAMERTDAAPAIAAKATSPGDPALRWQALRECLATDSETGMQVLSSLAASPDDPLLEPARQLFESLVAAHPELAVFRKDVPCPA